MIVLIRRTVITFSLNQNSKPVFLIRYFHLLCQKKVQIYELGTRDATYLLTPQLQLQLWVEMWLSTATKNYVASIIHSLTLTFKKKKERKGKTEGKYLLTISDKRLLPSFSRSVPPLKTGRCLRDRYNLFFACFFLFHSFFIKAYVWVFTSLPGKRAQLRQLRKKSPF